MDKRSALVGGGLLLIAAAVLAIRLLDAPAHAQTGKPVQAAQDEWRVAAGASESGTGAAKGRFIIYNTHTAESYILDNNGTKWIGLPYTDDSNGERAFPASRRKK